MLMGGIPSLRWTWPQSSGRLTTRRPQSTAAELEGQCFMATCIFTQDINIIPTTLAPARRDVSRRPQSTPRQEVGAAGLLDRHGGSAAPRIGSARRWCGSSLHAPGGKRSVPPVAHGALALGISPGREKRLVAWVSKNSVTLYVCKYMM